MPTDRRTFLLGAAAAASAALAGCGDGEGGPRPPREHPPETGDDEPAPDRQRGTPAYVYTPTVADWVARENGQGNLTLEVALRSIHPAPTEGTMRIRFETTDGEKVFTRPVRVDSEGTTNVTVDLPVEYDAYTLNMSLPAFSFRNVSER